MKLRVNAPVEHATAVLQRYALLSGQLAKAEAIRDAAIAKTNAAADEIALRITGELKTLQAEIEPWWARNGAALLPAKRKTMELGGCIVGSKAGTSKLTFAHGDDKAGLAALRDAKWAKPYVTVTYSIDKVATAKALASGKHAAGLTEIGFSKPDAGEDFVLAPVKQEGTVAG